MNTLTVVTILILFFVGNLVFVGDRVGAGEGMPGVDCAFTEPIATLAITRTVNKCIVFRLQLSWRQFDLCNRNKSH